MITIRQPLSFSEIGKKDNQEDFLFPAKATPDTKVFILCDGMGGHERGEVASSTAANAIGGYLDKHTPVTIGVFSEALQCGYDALDAIDTGNPKKPGTTLTCLCLNENDYLVAHIGDSRIYHIRPSLYNPATKRGGILYQSSDHSLVNDLLKAGELTEEEARNFPQKNVITRAMQPHLAKRYKADAYTFRDIAAGDYFFLCCDGVLERLSNEELCAILAHPGWNDARKLAEIKAVCDRGTRDNYSCWLVPVESAEIPQDANASTSTIKAEAIAGDRTQTVRLQAPATPQKGTVKRGIIPTASTQAAPKALKVLIGSAVVLIIAAIITLVLLLTGVLNSPKETPSEETAPPVVAPTDAPDVEESQSTPTPDYRSDQSDGPEQSDNSGNLLETAKKSATEAKDAPEQAKPSATKEQPKLSAPAKTQSKPSATATGQPNPSATATEQTKPSATVKQEPKSSAAKEFVDQTKEKIKENTPKSSGKSSETDAV